VFLIAKLVNKNIAITNIDGPMGVRGRNSHNKLIKETIDWAPNENLEYGLIQTYNWIENQIKNNKVDHE
jgi:dTDP-D-glucose 4,6-dehydratase